ncbi:YbaB/EbfC family nucleoid-associated protein [Candidatus Sumerlaeota bacterium]|nr:YbaB/EbfC family nucleoid-associated protein [Candidatus Sumerlaeota bacterium]
MSKLQEEMETKTIEGVAGGGALKVTVNGNQEIKKVEILPEAVDPEDIAMLEDLFRAAANQAIEKSKALQQESMSHLTGGMKIPDLPFF